MNAHDRIIVRLKAGQPTPAETIMGFAHDLASAAAALIFVGGVGLALIALSVPH